ncbi:MAG: VCBS repeat-containing protein [Acidobacteria bacterium]|nr:VCBS repeat-containing protein [Acidobacteriota bacterium]
MTRIILFVSVVLLTGGTLSGQEPIIPIVQGSYLVGGTQGGKWLKPARVPLGASPKFRSVRNDADDKTILIGRTNEKWGACDENRIVRFDSGDEPVDELPGLFIGERANWNLIPRRPVKSESGDPAIINAVATFLRSKGIRKSPTRITEALSIDLDGDGNAEEIITGYYYRRWEEFALSAGDYSFALLRVGSGRAMQNILLDGQFLDERVLADYAEHSVVAVADMNGDGRMEIAIKSTHSESDRQMLFEFQRGKAVMLFDESCGG